MERKENEVEWSQTHINIHSTCGAIHNQSNTAWKDSPFRSIIFQYVVSLTFSESHIYPLHFIHFEHFFLLHGVPLFSTKPTNYAQLKRWKMQQTHIHSFGTRQMQTRVGWNFILIIMTLYASKISDRHLYCAFMKWMQLSLKWRKMGIVQHLKESESIQRLLLPWQELGRTLIQFCLWNFSHKIIRISCKRSISYDWIVLSRIYQFK